MALLKPDQAEQMQRIELPRIVRQHRTIDRLRLGDAAHLMQHFPLLDRLHRRRYAIGSTAKLAGASPL